MALTLAGFCLSSLARIEPVWVAVAGAAAAARHGVDDAVRWALPVGDSLPELLGVACVAAALANLVNNLPATLILVPAAVAPVGTPRCWRC